MATVMVTVGTDGNTDWVKLPNGEKLTLGAVSVARFLGALTRQPLRKSLDSFLLYGETTASVDLDQMFDLLKPIRVRLADGSFIPSLGQTSTRNPMNELLAIEASISQAEKILGVLARKAASGQTNGIETVRQDFIKAANKIKSPNQSKNQTYYNLGEPQVEVAPTAKSAGAKLAYDVLQDNSTVAGEILACLEETNDRVDALVTAGKRFNASRAKQDLHAVSTKVAGILRDADLTQSWVKTDLTKLASRAMEIHGIFFSKGQQGG